MATNRSAGDFGCCGSWNRGCAIDMGCIYGEMCSTEEDRQTALVYAMEHCNVFKKIYLERDKEFTERWKASVKRVGMPHRQIHRSMERPVTAAEKALKEAQELLKSLGIKL